MIRTGLLQELDQSKLPVLKNFNPSYLNLPFDPGNKYTIPYQAGTDAIVYNTDTVTNLLPLPGMICGSLNTPAS